GAVVAPAHRPGTGQVQGRRPHRHRNPWRTAMTAADRPSVTDNARAEALAKERYPLREETNYHAGLYRGFLEGWAAARAATTAATVEDALGCHIEERAGVRVLVWSQGGCAPAATAERAMWNLLLAPARTRPTREQIAKVLARHDGKPAATTADAVLALWADQPTEAEAGARALEQAADTLGTRGRMSPQALRDRANNLRAGG